MARLLSILWVCAAVTACVHEAPDSRLDARGEVDLRELGALMKLDCSLLREEVARARDAVRPDGDRVANYRLAHQAFEDTAAQIHSVLSKDPDLVVLPEGAALLQRRLRCQSLAVSVAAELRDFELALANRSAPVPEKKEVVAAAGPGPSREVKELEEPKEPTQSLKKAKKSKAAAAKSKKTRRPHAVLADASR